METVLGEHGQGHSRQQAARGPGSCPICRSTRSIEGRRPRARRFRARAPRSAPGREATNEARHLRRSRPRDHHRGRDRSLPQRFHRRPDAAGAGPPLWRNCPQDRSSPASTTSCRSSIPSSTSTSASSTSNSPPLEIIASDQKRLVVDAFGRYRIVNPLLFYQSVGTVAVAESRLSVVLNSAVRRVLGDASFIDVVRDRRAQLMEQITRAGRQPSRCPRREGRRCEDPPCRPSGSEQSGNLPTHADRAPTQGSADSRGRRAAGPADPRRSRSLRYGIVAEATGESERLRGEGEARTEQDPRAGFRQGSRLLRLLSLDAGLSDEPEGSRHAAGHRRPIRISSATSTIPTQSPVQACRARRERLPQPFRRGRAARQAAEAAPAALAGAAPPAPAAQPESPPLPAACVAAAAIVPALVRRRASPQ